MNMQQVEGLNINNKLTEKEKAAFKNLSSGSRSAWDLTSEKINKEQNAARKKRGLKFYL